VSQPTLFDVVLDPLPCRSADPATSRVAARMLSMKERKREVLESMQALGGTVTVWEIQADMARRGILRERPTIASRLSQLRRDGLVCKVGVRDGDAGRPVTTWRLS
jgi:hypothetical protein